MKVLFLVKSAKTPSSRIRVIDLLPQLKAAGLEPEVEFLPKSFWKRRKLFKKAADFEITVLQKRLLSFWDRRELRKYAKLLVYDFDDAIYCKNASCSPNPKDYESSTRRRKFRATIENCDMVIAANQVLAENVRLVTTRIPVKVVPSPVPTTEISVKSDYTLQNPAILGWVGTASTLRYLENLLPALREVRSRHDFKLRLLSDEELALPGIKVENIPWSLEAQDRCIPEFDIGLMPLTQDPFSEGKSAYKLLQYMAAAVPSIASAVGMNIEVAEEEKNCLLASNPNEFTSGIERLLTNRELRAELGRTGRELTIQRYSREVVGTQLAKVLLSLK